MSALNTFRILHKEANTFEVEVSIVHPDEHQICRAKNFALQIILELYDNILKGSIYNSNWCSYPFTLEESKKYLRPTYAKDIENLLALYHGEKVSISQEEYDRRIKEGDYKYKDQGVGYLSGAANDCFIGLRPNFLQCCNTADSLIEKVELVSFENYPHWFDTFEIWLAYQKFYDFPSSVYDQKSAEEPKNPSYVLRVTMHEEGYYLLHHLVPQCFWDSAAYNYEIEFKNKFALSSLSTDLQYKTDIIQEFTTEQLSHWWQLLSDNWKQVLQMNLFMQSNYLPLEVVRELDGNFLLSKFVSTHPNIIFTTPTEKELRNMTMLKALYANGIDLINLDPLVYLPHLIILQCEDCNLTNIESLGLLSQLEYLNICCNDAITELNAIAKLPLLKYLTFEPNSQDGFDIVKSLRLLKKLYVYTNFEIETSVLSGLNELSSVYGTSHSIQQDSIQVLQTLFDRGVAIYWRRSEDDTELTFE